MVSQFELLGLEDRFVNTVEKMGYLEPTPIQQMAIPTMLAGGDVIGQAQTGTGKTAAFILPILQKMSRKSNAVQALVLAPTRELAKQVAEAADQFAQETGIKTLAVYGGQAYTVQTRALKRGVDLVVGTPGRLLDLIRQGALELGDVHFLVLDEADEMLEMGFIDDVESILKELSIDRQVALFSATMPAPIKKLAQRYMQDPQHINVIAQQMTVAEIEQRVYSVREEKKVPALSRLLEVEVISSGLIFVRTKARSQELSDELNRNGFAADVLNGDLNQNKREQVLDRFRQHHLKFLVATDVAARGLDIDDVSHVINFDFPQDVEDYVHRIGRTGRAGKTGIAITFLTPRERGQLKDVIAFTKQEVKDCAFPTFEEVEAARENRLVQKLSDQMIAGVTPAERQLVEHLGELGLNSMEIAVAAIRSMKANEAKLENIDLNSVVRRDNDSRSRKQYDNSQSQKDNWGSRERKGKGFSKNKPGPMETGMVRLWMNLGNNNGIRPGDVVGAIASEVGIPGKAIGAITILGDHTLVDISEKHVTKVLDASKGKYHLKGKSVMLKLAD
jgi:ATP-dependent RNA helicase DeaD